MYLLLIKSFSFYNGLEALFLQIPFYQENQYYSTDSGKKFRKDGE